MKKPQIQEPTFGTLSALPGNNPIQRGPAYASVMPYDARIPNRIPAGKVVTAKTTPPSQTNGQLPVPVTYVEKGCYADNYPFSRSMGGLGQFGGFVQNSMTNDLCTTYCMSQGFAYAGTEFRRECYCSSILPTTRLDASKCGMACAGDSSSICGGDNAISVTYIPSMEKNAAPVVQPPAISTSISLTPISIPKPTPSTTSVLKPSVTPFAVPSSNLPSSAFYVNIFSAQPRTFHPSGAFKVYTTAAFNPKICSIYCSASSACKSFSIYTELNSNKCALYSTVRSTVQAAYTSNIANAMYYVKII